MWTIHDQEANFKRYIVQSKHKFWDARFFRKSLTVSDPCTNGKIMGPKIKIFLKIVFSEFQASVIMMVLYFFKRSTLYRFEEYCQRSRLTGKFFPLNSKVPIRVNKRTENREYAPRDGYRCLKFQNSKGEEKLTGKQKMEDRQY